MFDSIPHPKFYLSIWSIFSDSLLVIDSFRFGDSYRISDTYLLYSQSIDVLFPM